MDREIESLRSLNKLFFKNPIDVDGSMCSALRLNTAKIRLHQSRINEMLHRKSYLPSKVVDTCRLENNAILKLHDIQIDFDKKINSYSIASFIPSAGVASRYVAPLYGLIEALKKYDRREIYQQITTWFCGDLFKDCLFPVELEYLIADQDAIFRVKNSFFAELLSKLSRVKALFPCDRIKTSFLDARKIENQCLPNIKSQIFITPDKQIDSFIIHSKYFTNIDTLYLEQSSDLSTIRFNERVEPIIDQSNRYSMVPGGDGELTSFFPEVKESLPYISALLIRNIDNTIGTSEEVVCEITKVLNLHQFIFNHFESIRRHLRNKNISSASKYAVDLYKALITKKDSTQHLHFKNDIEVLIALQKEVFHTPQSMLHHIDLVNLTRLYDRPLNILGMIANSGNDRGGVPVFIERNDDIIKVCLEMSHVSEQDQLNYFLNRQKATHLNSAFIIAELQERDAYKESCIPNWVVAKKKWGGKVVYYHETILHEKIGNSVDANVIFLEISRRLFAHSKTLIDTKDCYELFN